MIYAPNSGASHEAYTPATDEQLHALLNNVFGLRSPTRSVILELIDQRAERVRLQGEIERLTHELAEARGAGVQRGRGWAHLKDIEALSERIDQVCEIIGARIGGLEERLNNPPPATFGDTLRQAEDAVAVAEAEAWTAAVAQVEEPVAESEPLKPQRGDRVRLEGAIAYYGHDTIPEGWYDVLGCDAVTSSFQIKAATGALRWVEAGAGLKEVRRGAANLPE